MTRFNRLVPMLGLVLAAAGTPACGGRGSTVAPSGPQPRVLVLDLATGMITRIGTPQGLRIVYE